MSESNETINQLVARLDALSRKQADFSTEINALRAEIYKLNNASSQKTAVETSSVESTKVIDIAKEAQKAITQPTFGYKSQFKPSESPVDSFISDKVKANFEKFVGENLINRIGILILIIGVAIGAQYSIEYELISPLTRIILGYLMGLCLLGFGIFLKKNYLNFSAVLVSGAIAILYFITYLAYSLYDLFPQLFAFALMVAFTGFTVLAAINYNKQVIAHIGLVGAYAVPFLLSNGSGNISILFSYITIMNIGILVIAFQKYWKALYYSAFGFTWFIFSVWFFSEYKVDEHFAIALIFLSIYFTLFYLIFLGYKIVQKQQFEILDIVLLLANSFVFYGLGYGILSTSAIGAQLLGVFTLCNAVVHFVVSTIIYRQKLADRNLFHLVAGLVLVFITIAVPVQLDGNWVTLLWAFEAALLYWFGKTKQAPIFEILAYPLIYLAFFSIIHDWITIYPSYNLQDPGSKIIPFFNVNFLSNILFVVAFGLILYIQNNKKYETTAFELMELKQIMSFAIPVIFLIVLYNGFRIEISTYWEQLYTYSSIEIKKPNQEYANNYFNTDLIDLESIWLINYSLLFFSILSFINIYKIKNKVLGYINLVINYLHVLLFLGGSLYTLSALRESYISQSLAEYYEIGIFNIIIRYISFGFLALSIFSNYKYSKSDFLNLQSNNFRMAFDGLISITILWLASSELFNWMDLFAFADSNKLALSILWGIYAVILIVFGIWKHKKHIRIGAMALFAITLVKLFLYDISDLDTISKTIVFVSLGIMLLIISFLYNKFKQRISQEDEN